MSTSPISGRHEPLSSAVFAGSGAADAVAIEAILQQTHRQVAEFTRNIFGHTAIVEREFDTTTTSVYPDDETLGRAMVAVAGLAVIVGPERENELRAAVLDGLAPFRTADGSYRLSNEFRFLIASA